MRWEIVPPIETPLVMQYTPAQTHKHIEALRALDIVIKPNELDSILTTAEHHALNTKLGYWVQVRISISQLMFGVRGDAPTKKIKATKNLNDVFDDMTKDLKERKVIMDELDIIADKKFSSEFKPCGNNADWSVRAWYVGVGEPLMSVWPEKFLLDHEDGRYTITQRSNPGEDGEFVYLELIEIDLNNATTIEEGNEMIDLIGHCATYIVHNL